MIDVCRNDGAAAGDLGADKFRSDRIADCRLPIANWFRTGMAKMKILPAVAAIVDRGAGITDPGYSATHVFAKRDEFHFRRDDAAPCVCELGHHRSCACSQRLSSRES